MMKKGQAHWFQAMFDACERGWLVGFGIWEWAVCQKEGIMKSTEKRQQTSIGNFHKFQNENLA